MTDCRADSTLFFKYLRINFVPIIYSVMVLSLHYLLLVSFRGNGKAVSSIVWIVVEILKVYVCVLAFRKSSGFIRRGWFFALVYVALILGLILFRAFNDIFLHNNERLPYIFVIYFFSTAAIISAFLHFAYTSEVLFKIRRQLNLLGIILITLFLSSFLSNYRHMSDSAEAYTIVASTLWRLINMLAFIIGAGVYFITVWKMSLKRRIVFLLLLSSSLLSFLVNNFFIAEQTSRGRYIVGGTADIFITSSMLLVLFAGWNELKMDEGPEVENSYNLFYVSRVERAVPVLSLLVILVSLYRNLHKLDDDVARYLVLLMIPYCIFFYLFEMYSYRSEDAILSLLAISPTGVFITDRKFGKLYFVNRSFIEMVHSDEISPDFIVSAGEHEREKIVSAVSKSKTIRAMEILLKREDGSEFYALCKVIPTRYYSYDVVIFWVSDITDTKRYQELLLTEKSMAETASRYKSMLLNNLSNRIQSGYATMKAHPDGWPDMVLTGMNRRILEHFGIDGDQTGRTFREIFQSPDPVLIEQFFNVLNSGESLMREVRVSRVGKMFNILIFSAGEDEVAALIDDITESKKKGKELEERERELRTLLGNLPGMAYRCLNDEGKTMIFASQGSKELCGYSAAEITEKKSINWNSIIHPEDRGMVWEKIEKSLNSGENYHLEYRIISRDMRIKHVWEKGLGIFNDGGVLLFLEGVIFDVTLQKEAEEILRDNEIKIKEMEKVMALGRMAGGLAHDLNNRLMAIDACTSLIDLKVSDSDIRKYTTGIHESVRNSTELIENLFVFVRQQERHTDTFSLHSLLNNFLGSDEKIIPDGVVIKKDFLAADDRIKGDYKRIFKAVTDIVQNAVDAMPSGGEIIFSTENRGVDNSILADISGGNTKTKYIALKISDMGIGIESNEINRIFDPFYTTKPVGKGKGLGLSAVYGTIQAHKGGVTVESSKGSGTTFCVYLPVS